MNTTATALVTISTSRNASDGCRRLHFEGFVPWDNPENIVSQETEAFFERLKGAIVLPFLFLIGGPANVLNMAVFYKQGLRERINLCLFALALCDELYLVTCVLQNAERMYTQFASPGQRNGPVLTFIVNHNLIGFFGFTFVSQVISAIIASERCFCVISPLRSHLVLTTRTMAAILAIVFVIVMTLLFIVATRYRMVCVYDPVSNARFNVIDGGEFYYRNQELVDYLDSLVFGMVVPGATMLVVTVTTIVTAVKLRQAVAWRSETSSGALSAREVAVTKMLVVNSILFMVCGTPSLLFRFTILFFPKVKPGSQNQNLFLSLLWLVEIASYINSSFNIVVYHRMGSRFRDTLSMILCRWAKTTKVKVVEKPTGDD
ncbi:uncharacterized protein LOC143284321 [Babylonia areolata]|uniref:uncharacterized protein LOC143284321 n=1 Tax=Babylonia areolata TaxID=304850 RepID=UPI003FD37F1E